MRLLNTDLKVGYNENDLDDKKSYFCHLPFELRLKITTEYEDGDKARGSALLERIENNFFKKENGKFYSPFENMT